MFAKGTKLTLKAATAHQQNLGEVTGFEDSLTIGEVYAGVVNASGGVEVQGDDGVKRHYGLIQFDVLWVVAQ